MLSSYSHQKNILNSANNLLSNSVLYNVIELKKMNVKGIKLSLYKCDKCDKIFNHLSSEPIYSMFCGHKFHLNCCGNDKSNLNCDICKMNEFNYGDEEEITQHKSLISLNDSKDNSNDIYMQESKSKKDYLFIRLREFDKYHLERDLSVNQIK